MKSLWNSFKAAFAMFSKIPMPMVDWKKENIKYMMCFFPFVGTAIGILTWFAGGALGVHVALEPFFLAVILTVIPVFITGGIHVDGLPRRPVSPVCPVILIIVRFPPVSHIIEFLYEI